MKSFFFPIRKEQTQKQKIPVTKMPPDFNSGSFHGFDSFPGDRVGRHSLNDKLYGRLVGHGVAHDMANLATDPAHAAEFRVALQRELQMITGFHRSMTGATVCCNLHPTNNVVVITKGALPVTIEAPPAQWVEALKNSAARVLEQSPLTSSFYGTTGRRTFEDHEHASYPFSTPPEFRGFGAGASPLVTSPQVAVSEDDD